MGIWVLVGGYIATTASITTDVTGNAAYMIEKGQNLSSWH